jgi:putative ABC transport system substrate-binding protein
VAARRQSKWLELLSEIAPGLKRAAIIGPTQVRKRLTLGREPGGGLVVMGDTFTIAHRAAIILAAARNNVPAVYGNSDSVRDGGLLSYGSDVVENFRRAATYADRILRGAKLAELPVQLPTKFEMVLNLKTAKGLGLAIPLSILLRADEQIE